MAENINNNENNIHIIDTIIDITNIDSTVINNIDTNVDSNIDNICVICFDIIENNKKIIQCCDCKNIFHLSCLCCWYINNDKVVCPVCRSEHKNCLKKKRHEQNCKHLELFKENNHFEIDLKIYFYCFACTITTFVFPLLINHYFHHS